MIRKRIFIPIISALVAAILLLSPIAPVQHFTIPDIGPDTGQSLGQILHPFGNPFAHTFSDTKDIRTATFVVAASDSKNADMADYFCDGTDDQVEIQAAIDVSGGGKVQLLEGNFDISANINILGNTILTGSGASTILTTSGAVVTNVLTITGNNSEVSNMAITIAAGTGVNPNAVYATGRTGLVISNLKIIGDLTVADCGDDLHQNGVYLDACTNSTIVGCIVSSFKRQCILLGSSIGCIVDRNLCDGGGDAWYGINLIGSDDNTITGNYCINAENYGIELFNTCDNNTIVGNTCNDNDLCGIKFEVTSRFNVVTGNTCNNNGDHGICMSNSPNNTITGNTANGNTSYNLMITSGSSQCTITGNNFNDGGSFGASLAHSDYCVVTGNSFNNNTYGLNIKRCSYTTVLGNSFCNNSSMGIYMEGAGDTDYNTIEGNTIMNNTTYGILFDTNVNYNFVTGNRISGNGTDIKDTGIGNIYHEQYSNLFTEVLAVSTTHVVDDWDISGAGEIELNPATAKQPDIPRTLSWVFNGHTGVTEYDLVFEGIDGKGNTISETFTEADGWTGETSNAFAQITAIKYTRSANDGDVDNTMDIGITDVLGLSNIVYETKDVYKITKNAANQAVVAGDVDTTYDTYDMHTITLAATDVFTIWYRSNLNIIS